MKSENLFAIQHKNLKTYYVYLTAVDTYLAERKDSLPLEEQLRILLDKMDMANLNKRGQFGVNIYITIDD